MRSRFINTLKRHPKVLNLFWQCLRVFFKVIGGLIPIQDNKIMFSSFGGRKYDDSPRAIYEELLCRKDFKNWDFVWSFVEPDQFNIPKGRKVRIDTVSFFKELLSSKVWVSNSGMDRGIDIKKKGIIRVETWHGTPIKKIGGEENTGSLLADRNSIRTDNDVIRCAQSEYDLEIFSRIEKVNKKCFLLCDLPRNDILVKGIDDEQVKNIKASIGVPQGKKILLYMPTYREFLVDENKDTYLKPPIDLAKWRNALADQYTLLVRAHYAVTKALNIINDDFVIDVSNYQSVNDLYLIADVLISDYSSSFFDFAILDRPMVCFAYDLEEYSEKRGLYFDLAQELPCRINHTEDEVLDELLVLDYASASKSTRRFHNKYAPHAGNASTAVIDKIIERLNQ